MTPQDSQVFDFKKKINQPKQDAPQNQNPSETYLEQQVVDFYRQMPPACKETYLLIGLQLKNVPQPDPLPSINR